MWARAHNSSLTEALGGELGEVRVGVSVGLKPTDEELLETVAGYVEAGYVRVKLIVPPISLDSSLATLPGSKREEALNVSEYGRAGFGEGPRAAGGSAEAAKRANSKTSLRLS